MKTLNHIFYWYRFLVINGIVLGWRLNFSTIMMLFSVIDGLGKLTHPRRDAGVGMRFKYFISSLGSKYEVNKEKLWILRNSLMHNGMNPISFFASTYMGQDDHLETSWPNDMIYINTRKFLADFKARYDVLKNEILSNDVLIQRSGNRLRWAIEDTYITMINKPVTPPGRIEFVVSR